MKADTDFIKYCIDHYHKEHYSDAELKDDLYRITMLKKMFKRYESGFNVNGRVLINSVIILRNVFGIEHMNHILFYRLGDDNYSKLKTLLLLVDSYFENSMTRQITIDSQFAHFITSSLTE